MRLKLTFTLLLITLLTALASAQTPTREPLQIEVGDVVETTLAPNETATYQLTSESDHALALTINAGNEVSFRVEFNDNTVTRSGITLTDYFQRLEVSAGGVYTLFISNQMDTETTLTFSTTVIPTHDIEIGERHLINTGNATMLDLTFEAEAGDFVVIETSSPRISFRLEQLQRGGPPFFVLDMIDNMDTFTGVRLERPATYRIVARVQAAEVDYPPSEYIALNRPNRFNGTITAGQTVSGDLPPSLVAFDLNTEPGQPILITLESNGAQAYINDATGETLTSFGHTNVPYETLEVEWVRTENTMQTFQPFMPSMVELFGGPFTLSVDAIPLITVGDSPVRFRLNPDDDTPRFAQQLPAATYELTLTSTDPDAGIGVRIFDIFTQPFGSLRDLGFLFVDGGEQTTATFTLDDTTWVGFRFYPADGYSGSVTLTLNTAEEDA